MKRFSISPPVAALILAIVLFLLSGFLPNSYGSDVKVAIAQATNILRLAVFLGVIAAGQTLVIISGFEGIDLSAGSIVTLTAILTYVYVSGDDNKVLVALLIAMGVGALIGLLNGKLACSGVSVTDVLLDALDQAGVSDAELVTLYYGEGLSLKDAREMSDLAQGRFPEQEFELHNGGQPHYYYIASIE